MSIIGVDIAYIRRALAAAVEMARFRDDPIDRFDHTYEGFFRSFVAMVVAAPLYPLIVAGERSLVTEAAQTQGGAQGFVLHAVNLPYCIIEAISYTAGWILFPLVMIFIARLVGASARYVPYIVAYNWGSCLVFVLTALMHLLHLAGVLPLAATSFLYFPITMFALAYRWRIARLGLQVPGTTATGVVILDVLLSVFIAVSAGSLQGALA
ncbi:MAG TPA: hypothetical protein VFI93_03290 [Rhizomicrobium sp.]|nr:hypothetical protein [Rhizomicrobium sp.]